MFGVVSMGRDRRVVYTKGVIKEALLKLLNENTLEGITIKEICSEADINRATFYRHYKDIYDLFEQIEKEIIDEVYPDKSEIIFGQSLLYIIYENQGFYKEFFSKHLDSPVIIKVVEELYSEIRSLAEKDKNFSPKEFKYTFDYFLYGIIGILKEWVEKGCNESVEELYQIIVSISNRQFNQIFIG
jgi:AcrR family transcriptional regulator